jgi:hypothetical protein
LQARRHARLVRDALSERDDLKALKPPLPPRTEMTLRFAEEWAAKMSRMSYDALLEKARYIMAERKARLRAERDAQNLFPPQDIDASPGRVWRRIVSVAELRRAGRDLRNCLAGPSGQRHGYVQRLRDDVTRFWALHDETRIARAVLAVDAASAAVKEARGFRNAPFALEGADFAALAAAGAARAPTPPERPRLQPQRRALAQDENIRRRTAELLGTFILMRRDGPV